MLNPCQEKIHSASSHRKDERYLKVQEAKLLLLWQKMDNHKVWSDFDEAVFEKLENVSPLEARLELFQNSIYDEGYKRFGAKSSQRRKNRGPSRRQLLCIELVQQKNEVANDISSCSNSDKLLFLSGLMETVRGRLRALRKSERSRKNRWVRNKARKSFAADPYRAGKDLLEPKSGVSLAVDQETLDTHKAEVVFDPHFGESLRVIDGLPP